MYFYTAEQDKNKEQNKHASGKTKSKNKQTHETALIYKAYHALNQRIC